MATDETPSSTGAAPEKHKLTPEEEATWRKRLIEQNDQMITGAFRKAAQKAEEEAAKALQDDISVSALHQAPQIDTGTPREKPEMDAVNWANERVKARFLAEAQKQSPKPSK